jgi:hypothetical protein
VDSDQLQNPHRGHGGGAGDLTPGITVSAGVVIGFSLISG